MDEKYLQSLHSQLGGEGVFGKYEDFKNLIIRDPQYAKNFYNNFGRDVLGEENDFYSLVKKKDTGVSPSAPLAEGGSSESQPMVSPGQPVPSVTKVNNPSTYNKNIEFRDWQAHQELTRSLLKSAQKNDSAGIRNAQLQLERLRASNPNIASDPSLNEDLKIANKAIKAAPDKPTVKPIAEVVLGIKEKAQIPTKQRAQEEAKITELNKKLNVLGDPTPEELKNSFKLTMLELGLAEETSGFKEESKQYSEDEFSKIEDPDRLIFAIDNRLKFHLPSTSSRPIDDAIAQSILYFQKNKQQATNEEIIKKAKEILSDKKLQGSIDKEIDKILTFETPIAIDFANTLMNLVDPGKEIIKDPLVSGNQSDMLKDIESMKNKVVLEKARFDKKMENWNRLKNEIEDISQEEFKAMPGEDKKAFIAKQEELNILSKDLYNKFDAWSNSDDNIQDFKQEADLLKRNYGILSNAVGKAQAGALSILGGASRAIGFKGKSIESAEKLRSTLSKPISYKDVENPYDFFRYAGSQIADQASNFALAYGTGGMAPYIIGTSAAGQKYKELEKEETQAGKELYSTSQKLLTSILVGGLEVVTEKAEIEVWKKALPSWRLAEAAKKGASDLELNMMRDEFKKGIKSVITLGKETASNQIKEGSAEAFSQIGGNLADKYVLGKKNVGIFDGVDDAFVSGATIGGLITVAPALAAQAIAPFVNDPEKKIKSNSDKLKQLEIALADAEDINKPTVQSVIDKISNENVSLINGGVKIMDGLTPSEIRRNVELYDKIKEIKKQYLNIKNDASLSEEQKKSTIGILNEEYNSIVTERLSLLKKGETNAIQKQGSGQVPVQPETGVGQEVEQGKPQAEPQGVTKEAKKEVENLRAQEQSELVEAIPNIETFRVNGEIDKTLMPAEELAKYDKIYNKYDKLITPLLSEKPTVQESAQEKVTIDRPSIVSNTKTDVDSVRSQPLESETGQTFNLDGTVYDGGGLIVPVASENLTQEDLTPERIADFVERNSEKVGDQTVKVGIYKFPNSNQVSIDLNIAVPRKNRAAALEFGKQAGQESLFDLDTYENIKTGSDGKNPTKFTDEQFREISKALNEGRMPAISQQATVAKEQGAPATTKTKLGKNIKKAIAKVFPDLGVSEFKNAKEMKDYVANKYGQEMAKDFMKDDAARAIFDGTNIVEVLVNEELSDETTMSHEIWHGILSKAFGENEVLFDSFRKSIDKTLRDNGYDDIADELDAFAINPEYIESDTMAGEWLVQFGGMLASAKINPSKMNANQKSLLNQLKDIINRFAKKITGQEVFLEDATPENILEFMTGISDSLSRGEDISGFFKESGQAFGPSDIKITTKAQKKERDSWQKNGVKYTVGDIVDGSNLDELSGGLVDGRRGDKYILVQEPLSSFTESREELLRIDPEYAEEESFRLDSMKDNFEKTPPIPPDGDGMHRIVAAKELGFNTILMWKKLTDYEGKITTKAQKAAIEILDGPKFDNKLKEDVASYLNGLRDSVIPPNSSREELMERFINNVYEEVGYYLYSKPDARSAGLTWYIEDMVEFSNKIKVVLPELNDENQYKLFLSVLAFTSSGTNPNQNLLYAYNLWNNSKDPKNFDFSKTWAEKKLSFIDKSGKSIASGTIVKETAKDYTVQLIDSLGREEVDKKGNKKQQVIPKKSMKEGYPKPTGYTNRGEIIIGQLEKLEALYEGLGSIENVVNWLQTPQSIAELRKYNESVPDVNGKGPGKTNKEYDPRKNAEGKRNGAFIFGEKIGSFYQNMIGIGETITMDLWWSRTWNRYMGTMINTTSGNNEIQEVPRDDRERNIMRDAVKIVAEDLNLQVSELQAAIWYFEQELWTKAGNKSPSYSYVTAIDDLTKKLKVDEQTRSKLREAEADLSDAEKRRQNASERAAATIASKGGKTPSSKITTKAQKNHPYIPDKVFEKLTTDENGDVVFSHYSRLSELDQVKPSTGSGSLITSKEEQQALSSVGGLAMYYTQSGQKEQNVGNIQNTVTVDPSKVYYMNDDTLNFYDEAKKQFLDHMNRNNNKVVNYAFSPNYQVAWISKVANENGFDMVISKWRNDYDFRAQTRKTLKTQEEVIPMKPINNEEISVGDKIFLMGREVVLTEKDENGVYSYEGAGMSGKIPLEEAMRFGNYGPIYKLSSKPQKARLQKEVAGIIDKSTKRGATKDKAYENALNYLQKSKYYQEADDSERETLVRELRSAMGLKEKRNISVGKILGAIKDIVNITAKESTLLKDQIKLESKAGKAAAKEVNDLRKALSLEVAELAKAGKITTKQAATIIKRIGSVNLSNPSVVDGFVDYMTKVFNDADYSEKVRKANENIKKIKRFYKGKDVQATVNLMAKNFLTIDPKKLSNIDEYLAMSNEVLQAVMPISTTAGVKIRVAADVAKINDYINAAAKEQAKKVKDDLLSEYQYLIDAGVIDDSMSYDEIVEIIDSIEDSAAQDVLDKGEDVRQYIVKMFNSLSSIGKEILSKGEDPVTGLPVDLSDDQKAVLKKFLNMDIENMSIKDAKLALEYLSNFITNGITDGMAGIVETYSGSENLKTFINTGAKFRNLKLFFSKKAGRFIAEQLTNLNILLETALSGQDRSSLFRRLSGFNEIVNGNAKARKIASVKLDQYYNKFKDVKDFFTAENNIERGVLSFLVRTNESSDELERRKGLIEQSIEKMMEGNEQEVAKAEIIKEVYERIGKNAKTTQDVFDAAKKENRDAVNWWINNWNSDYDRLKDVSLNIYNADLGKDKDYTPDVYDKIKEDTEAADLGKSAFMMSTNDYTVKKKTGVLMEAKKPSRLSKNRVVSFDFDTNNARAYEAALIDIETAAPIRMIDGFINSKEFSKLGSADDVEKIKSRINGYIGEIRGKNFVPKSSMDDLNKGLDKIGSIGASMALGGVTQPLKQTIPVIINTLINNGLYFDLSSGFNKNINKFIDECGFPIANRGIESTASIKTADRYLEEASRSGGNKAIDLVKKAGDVYLNTFLKSPDVFVARASFISYYKKELKRRGVNVNGIDWSTHEVNKSAAQYAQDMVDRQQNVSDAALMGDLMTSKDPLKQVIKKTVFTFMSFVMNQKARMYSDIITLRSKQSTKEDKKMAAWSLAALSSEMATFSLVGGAIAEFINWSVRSMMGVDEDEEQRAKRRKSRYETVTTNISKDFLSPLPFTDAAVVFALNTALDQYYNLTEKDEDDEEKTDRFRLFEKKESSVFDNWGAAGITASRYMEMIDLMKMAYTGEFEQEFIKGKPTTKYLRDEDKKTLSGLSFVQIGANLGLLPSEATAIVRSATKIAKKRARREEDHLEAEYYKERGTQLPDYLK